MGRDVGRDVLLKLDGIGDIAAWCADPSAARLQLDECLDRLPMLKVVDEQDKVDQVSSKCWFCGWQGDKTNVDNERNHY